MADLDRRQPTPHSYGGGLGWGVVILAVVAVLLAVWVFRSGEPGTGFLGGIGGAGEADDTSVPAAEAPRIDIPDQIDVNIGVPGRDPPEAEAPAPAEASATAGADVQEDGVGGAE